VEINMSLKIIGVSYAINNISLVNSISLNIQSGSVHAVVGPNGAGKSTLFSLIAGEIPQKNGSITWNGIEFSDLPMWRRVRLGMGYLPQQSLGFESMTVIDNLSLIHCEQRDQIIHNLGLAELKDIKLGLLSGGERRKVDIARLLLLEAKLWILDEPFSALDGSTIQWMIDVIKVVVKNGVTILLTDHALAQVMNIADHISIMEKGNIIVSNTPNKLKESPFFKQRYSLI
jgi:lipopolysaccharide export system ATP-binding protein